LAIIRNLTTKEVFDLIRDDLQKVEVELAHQVESSVEPVTEMGQYLQVSGGKRLRPALLLLSSKFCGYEGPSAIRLGAVMELIHAATLVHDDIIDNAQIRRGRPSVNTRWGNQTSVLAGDWFYMQGFNIALTERKFKVLDLLIGLTQVMVEGELLQLGCLRKVETTEEEYFELTYRKTASLFSTCLLMGAALGECSDEAEASLGSYGINLGMAFQIVDDILDFTSSEEKLGKPVGNDMREGKVTLPLIYALRRCAPEEVQKVSKVFEEDGFRSVPFSEIMDLQNRYGGLIAAREKASSYVEKAKGCLAMFPDSLYKDALLSLPDFIVERES
jgi:octaprenyl-diphosphate synthase